jgi:hypothetical protein
MEVIVTLYYGVQVMRVAIDHAQFATLLWYRDRRVPELNIGANKCSEESMFVNSKRSVLTAHTVQRRIAGNPVKVDLAGGDVDIYQTQPKEL